jgi:hypothetical protein
VAPSSLASIERIAALTARERVLIAGRSGGDVPEIGEPDKVAALLEVARALHLARAPFALIGGVAVGVHSGVPRATLDIDLAVRSSVDRAALVRALAEAGLRPAGEFAHSSNFRHRSGEPVQLAFDPEFDPMIDRAEQIEVSGESVPIVRKSDLIAMKRRAAADPGRRRSKRLRDEADVALLEGDVPDPDEGW